MAKNPLLNSENTQRTETVITKNPFVCFFRGVPAGVEFPDGFKLRNYGGQVYYYLNGYNISNSVSERQIFDDFGNVTYELQYLS